MASHAFGKNGESMQTLWTFIAICLSCWLVTAHDVSAQDQFPNVASLEGSKTTPQAIRQIQQTLRKDYYPNCYNIKPLRLSDMAPPYIVRATSFPAGTTWSETWIVNVCGARKYHHIDFTMIAVNNQVALEMSVRPAQVAVIEGPVEPAKVDRNKIPVVKELDGSPTTQSMILAVQEYLQGVYYQSCAEIKPLSSLSVFPKNEALKQNFKVGDTWAETWLVETCSGPKEHHIDFFIAPVGDKLGLLIRAQPATDK
jgi:hypothetical protein